MSNLPSDIRECIYDAGVEGFQVWLTRDYVISPYDCYKAVAHLMISEFAAAGFSHEKIEELGTVFTEGWSHAHENFEKLLRDRDWVELLVEMPFGRLWEAYTYWCKHFDLKPEPLNTVYALYYTYREGAPERVEVN